MKINYFVANDTIPKTIVINNVPDFNCLLCGKPTFWEPDLGDKPICDSCWDRGYDKDFNKRECKIKVKQLTREKQQSRQLEIRKARLELGLCYYCYNPALPSSTLCLSCKTKKRIEKRKQYETRKALGLCVHCKKPALPGHNHCAEHINYYKERYQNKKRQKNPS